MQYFKIAASINPKQIGNTYPQAEGVYTEHVDNPAYLFNAFRDFEKVDQEVLVPMAKLCKKSTNLTDMLSSGGYGLELRWLISDRLKAILENSKHLGYQYLSTTVYDFSGTAPFPYWLTNTWLFFPEYINYSQSELWLRGSGGVQQLERVYCDSYEDFERKTKLHAPVPIMIEKMVLDAGQIEYDLFAVNNVYGVIAHICSEKLKNEIETSGCTGIDFKPVDAM
jgi:hypothetical protein